MTSKSAPYWKPCFVEAEIFAIANPKKSEAIMKAKREEEEEQREEERIKEERARLIKEGIDAERAKIWNFLNRFCVEISYKEVRQTDVH